MSIGGDGTCLIGVVPAYHCSHPLIVEVYIASAEEPIEFSNARHDDIENLIGDILKDRFL